MFHSSRGALTRERAVAATCQTTARVCKELSFAASQLHDRVERSLITKQQTDFGTSYADSQIDMLEHCIDFS